MKIRADFVTNSSSSSFIIRKEFSVDDIFNVLLEFCKDYNERMSRAIEYLKLTGYTTSISIEGNLVRVGPPDIDRWALEDQVEDNFKVSLYWYRLPESLQKLAECTNYAEYKLKCAEDPSLNLIHIYTYAESFHPDRWEDTLHDDLVRWYCDSDDDPEFDNNTRDCSILYSAEGISFLPEFVLKKLRSMSVYSCAHMG